MQQAGRRIVGGRRAFGRHNSRQSNGPLISIITVVLDRVAPLERTINSVLAQTYPNVEYLIIDGGSGPETIRVINQYLDHIAYFVSEPDFGEYDATNKGIKQATGDYVCLLNAADSYHPEAVAQMVAHARLFPGSIIYTNYTYGKKTINPPDALTPAFNLYNMGVAHQSLMVPRSLHEAIGLYDTEFRIVSDYVWMRTAFRSGVRFEKVSFNALDFDDTGISSKSDPETTQLFEAEFAKRTRALYEFVPDPVARALFRYIHFGGCLEQCLSWIEMVRPRAMDHPLWLDFEDAISAAMVHISQLET